MSAAIPIPAGTYRAADAHCPVGKRVLGGGGGNTAEGTIVLTDSLAIATDTWRVYFKNNGTTDGTIHASAICATVA